MTIRTILILTLACFPVFTQSNQKAIDRTTELVSVRDGKRKVVAYEHATIVYDDQGREIPIVRSKKGKMRGHGQLKPWEYWVQRDGFREHRATVEIKDVNEFDLTVTKGAPQILSSAWPRGSTVPVYSQGFTPEQQKAIERALLAWNVGLVTFQYKGEGEGRLTIKRKPVVQIRGSAYSDIVFTLAENSVVVESTVWIDPKVSKPDVITSLVAHEIGHQFGFTDCYDCKSVMKRFPGIRKDNGYFGPTVLDLELLRP